ncbi:MAG: T9SS type A sorting domain-containing protein [candidate division WOR-3 bacterium]
MPVKLRITGPQGYVREWNNDTTAGTMPYRGTNVVTFRPTWRTPDTAGLYELKVWTELAGDEFRGNDTMVRLMNIAKWYSYADWNSTRIWISAAGPEKAVQFHPPDFRVNYPVEISRVRSYFYLHPQLPWDDSIFTYAIYGDDGSTLLWQSDTLRAAPNQAKDCAVEPPVLIESGDFFLATVPRSGSGRPTSTSDTLQQAHSFYGSGSTGWLPWTLGEWQFAVSFKTRISGIAEGSTSILPSVRVSSASNPTARPVIHWQIPKATPVAITLYDATGRAARTYQVNPSAQVLSGSLKLDTKGIARGIYLVRLTAGGSRADAKLVLSD